MSKRFRKVRRTSKPNLEPPEPSVCLQKPNLEPTEPQKTEPNLEPNQVRPNTNLVPMPCILTYICCRVYDVFSNICRFDAYNTLISKLNLYFTS